MPSCFGIARCVVQHLPELLNAKRSSPTAARDSRLVAHLAQHQPFPHQSSPTLLLITATSPFLGHRNVPSAITLQSSRLSLFSQSRGKKKCWRTALASSPDRSRYVHTQLSLSKKTSFSLERTPRGITTRARMAGETGSDVSTEGEI